MPVIRPRPAGTPAATYPIEVTARDRTCETIPKVHPAQALAATEQGLIRNCPDRSTKQSGPDGGPSLQRARQCSPRANGSIRSSREFP